MIAAGEAVLLGDVGATNARFAVHFDEMLGPIEWIEVADHPTFDGALKHFLQSHGRDHRIAHALLAIAGPVKDDRCEFTNCPWTVDSRDLRNQFGFRSVQLVNDFEATALSLPHLAKQDLRSIGEGRGVLGAPMVVLGPGSGLGVAGLVQNGAGPRRRPDRRRPRHDGRRLTPRRCDPQRAEATLRSCFSRTDSFRAWHRKSL